MAERGPTAQNVGSGRQGDRAPKRQADRTGQGRRIRKTKRVSRTRGNREKNKEKGRGEKKKGNKAGKWERDSNTESI